MNRVAALLVTLPLALAGVEAAHAAANSGFGAPEGAGELFGSAATGAELAPLVGAVAFALLLAGVCARALAAEAPNANVRLSALPFAFAPPVAFVSLELVEALAHRGEISPAEIGEPTFLVGLLLQLPFAVAAYVVARLLIRAGRALRHWFVARRSSVIRRQNGRNHLPVAPPPRDLTVSCGYRGRAPPRLVAAR